MKRNFLLLIAVSISIQAYSASKSKGKFCHFFRIQDTTDVDTIRARVDSIHNLIPPPADKAKIPKDTLSTDTVSTSSVVQENVSGKVVDDAGAPLAGATVLVRRGKVGATTDQGGNFTITANDVDTLDVTFLGFDPISFPIAGQDSLLIRLSKEGGGRGEEIDEIVVIGYGTARKKDLTGAQSNVSGDDLAKRNQMNLSQSMQGTMPGVTATRRSSAGNASASILVRGVTSIGSNEPLYVVDGVPVGSLNDVNPQDIEDVTVLKDGASASIYGARAAAGVILVTTKRGKADESNIEYNGRGQVLRPTMLPTSVGTQRYLEMMNEQSWNDGGNIAGSEFPIYPEEQLNSWLENSLTDANNFPSTDWRHLVLKDHAMGQSHGISVQAGGERIQSRASVTYDQIGEIYDHKNFQRVQSRFNNNFMISDKFTADLDLSYIIEENNSPRINPIFNAIMYAPIYSAMWTDGRLAGGKTGDNIYAGLNYGGNDDILDRKLNGRFALHYEPLEGLKISAVVAPTLYNQKRKIMTKQIPYYAPDDENLFMGYISGFQRNMLDERRNDQTKVTKQFLINYTKYIADHNFNILAAYEDYMAKGENLGVVGDYLPLSEYPYQDIAPIEYQQSSGNAYQVAYRSYFGRLIYDYKGKYLLQANVRYDGSSRFHPDHRWGAFPSVSAGWILSEESFMQDNGVFDFLKVRASWGRLGNERIANGANYYPYFAIMAFGNTLFYRGNTVVTDATASQTTYAIQDISWETTETQNLGLDMSFFDNRLSVTGDLFKKRTFQMLLSLDIPKFMGYDNPQQNSGIMNSKGWELAVGWKDKINDFTYSVAVNLSDSKSKMENMSGRIMYNGNLITREGSEYQEWYGYRAKGIFQTQEQVDTSPLTSTNVSPGDIQYEDISGPDGIPDGVITPDHDRVLLGGSLPRYTYGAIINLGYKNFDFSISLQGVGKINTYLSTQMIQPFQGAWLSPPSIYDGNYWSMYNNEAQNRTATYPRLSTTGNTNNYNTGSDFWLFDGRYLRVKNISIGYTLPQKWIENMRLKGLRIFANGTDLFSFDKFPDGWDPELTPQSPSLQWDPAGGASSYISKTINFGVSVKF